MKLARFWLLVLLAVLLPLRGALAGAMPCGGAAQTPQQDGMPAHHAQVTGHQHQHQHEHEHEHEHEHQHQHGPGPAGTCSLCAACCSPTPWASHLLTVPMAQDAATTTFPRLRAAAERFLSDGPERPPRSA